MTAEYRVLARKYRPQNFDDLVGQDVLVRTLSNAIKSGRIAHAFLLTGIRGIGKTTTARIIARALNCIGEDGKGGATISPCGVCSNCKQITDDRHVDVLEMDAASRTGVSDMRDLIETVHYAPTSARYKIYIIDEVHMLSNSAFNALLKTLEEPPPHVKFIFATTETRKIPVTILSRCQRFDLKRLDVEMLAEHLSNICTKEEVEAEAEGLSLISMAAEGSVRDGLSLLDRAISHSHNEDGKTVPIATIAVRDMLGLSDSSRIFTLLEALFSGKPKEALEVLNQQYADGADITMLLQDMLGLVHILTRLKLDESDKLSPAYSESEQKLAKELAAKLSVGALSRTWQMILKGLDEVKHAPDALMAAEMVIIRLSHAANMPSPEDIVKKLKTERDSGTTPPPTGGGGGVAYTAGSNAVHAPMIHSEPVPSHAPQARGSHLTLAAHNPAFNIELFEDVAELLRRKRAAKLRHSLEHEVALISFEKGKITLKKTGHVENGFTKELAEIMQAETNNVWQIIFGEGDAESTIGEQREMARLAEIEEVSQHELVKNILEVFTDSKIKEVKLKPEEIIITAPADDSDYESTNNE